jgi:hypothetical protein
MRIREALAFILFGKPVRRRPRGADRLLRDVAAVGRMTAGERMEAADRLMAAVGPDLLRDLERRLELEGRLVPTAPARRRTRRAA